MLGRFFSQKGSRLRIAVAAIFKNELPYVVEWVAYHRAVGIDRFFIADNNSDDGTSVLLAKLAAANLVDHILFPGTPNVAPQLPAYIEIMRRHGREADWIAFIDADEFLFSTDDSHSVREAIEGLHHDPSVGAIGVNWATFGSSGHEGPSEELVIERFSKRAAKGWSENYHYKSIVRSSAFSAPSGTPHAFLLRPEWQYVHPTGEALVDHEVRGSGLSRDLSWHRLRLNHYVVKSRKEFFDRKGPKGRATVVGQTKGANYFSAHDRNEVNDPFPAHLVDRVKREIEDIRAVIGGVPAVEAERPPSGDAARPQETKA